MAAIILYEEVDNDLLIYSTSEEPIRIFSKRKDERYYPILIEKYILGSGFIILRKYSGNISVKGDVI
jgi:hypothetical protein